jgi:glycosyltransferase involved in cell wall biosynthesis
MEKATFFIYPSEAKEGETFGLAVLEAMSCGCIPVVSALPCFTDFISFEEEGFCLKQGINMNMEEAILEALPKILALNESQTSKLGLTAWKRSKEYELEKVAQAYLEDFTSLL